MLFIKTEDQKVIIKDKVLANVLQEDELAWQEVEAMAIEQMTFYLNGLYDCAAIFSGENRNKFVVMMCLDIMAYHVYARINPHQIPQLRKERYDAQISLLEQIAKGKIQVPLPKRKQEDGNNYEGFKANSNRKFNHYF
jgi:phage gp36-like protein